MKYLLDVNALAALLISEHSLHARTLAWIQGLIRTESPSPLLTCSITELGFLRIVSNTYGHTVEGVQDLLSHAKSGTIVKFVFLFDDQPSSRLPPWVSRSHQVTDGHLVSLAKKHGAALATLDEKIPGAFLIPR